MPQKKGTKLSATLWLVAFLCVTFLTHHNCVVYQSPGRRYIDSISESFCENPLFSCTGCSDNEREFLAEYLYVVYQENICELEIDVQKQGSRYKIQVSPTEEREDPLNLVECEGSLPCNQFSNGSCSDDIKENIGNNSYSCSFRTEGDDTINIAVEGKRNSCSNEERSVKCSFEFTVPSSSDVTERGRELRPAAELLAQELVIVFLKMFDENNNESDD